MQSMRSVFGKPFRMAQTHISAFRFGYFSVVRLDASLFAFVSRVGEPISQTPLLYFTLHYSATPEPASTVVVIPLSLKCALPLSETRL